MYPEQHALPQLQGHDRGANLATSAAR